MTEQMNTDEKIIYEAKDVSFTYPKGRRQILDSVSLVLKKGEILSVLGANGAGKTTLLNCMAGLLKPDHGSIELCGRNTKEMTAKEIAGKTAYVPQLHTPAFDYKVGDFVLMGRAPKKGTFESPGEEDKKIASKVLKEMGIDHLADRSYIEISGGERQQALIARAMVQEPEVILFDEPTAHLDFGNQHRVLDMIRKMTSEGFAIVITTHNPDHALMLGGTTAIIDSKGKMIQGKASEILSEERISGIYDTDIRLIYIEEIGRKVCVMPDF